jgi:FKBP-type peptidyl-prolyl cis-trans isomerase 2
MPVSRGDTVTVEYVGRTADGTVFDTSRESVAAAEGLDHHPDRSYDPLTVEIGSGRIIEGLEEGLLGLEVGEEATIEVPPEEGYGSHTDDRVVAYDAPEFREMVDTAQPQEGLEVKTNEGLPGTVVGVGDDVVRVDFNYDLAGKHLAFEVEILAVE